METNNAQTAIETLAADPTLAGCTWDERGITPVRDPSAAPLPLRDCGIFRPLNDRRRLDVQKNLRVH
jgi:hypothetical protein